MAESTNWAFPENLQPAPEDVSFDLEGAFDAVVSVRAEIPEDAFTAPILGTERLGNGVVIRDDGLILTIGYLVTEAQTIWLTTNGGAVLPGYPLAYDQVTGFGLVQLLGRLKTRVLQRGSIASTEFGDDVLVIGHGGRAHALKAKIIGKREFAGYWEYVLDEALFTAPAHPQWGGAALVGQDGRLLGIGSLLVQEMVEGESVQGNMIVPIDLLAPILDEMLTMGRPNRPPRPWLGMYTAEVSDHLVVNGLAKGGPADVAGARLGDVVVEIGGIRPSGLADFYRKLWRQGGPGTMVPLTLARDGAVLRVAIRAANRDDYMKKPQLQ